MQLLDDALLASRDFGGRAVPVGSLWRVGVNRGNVLLRGRMRGFCGSSLALIQVRSSFTARSGGLRVASSLVGGGWQMAP